MSNNCVVCGRRMDELVPGTDRTHISFQVEHYNHSHWRGHNADENTIYDLGYRSAFVLSDELINKYTDYKTHPVYIMGLQDAQGDKELAILDCDD